MLTREIVNIEDVYEHVQSMIDRDMVTLKEHTVLTDSNRDITECISARVYALFEVKSYIERGKAGA